MVSENIMKVNNSEFPLTVIYTFIHYIVQTVVVRLRNRQFTFSGLTGLGPPTAAAYVYWEKVQRLRSAQSAPLVSCWGGLSLVGGVDRTSGWSNEVTGMPGQTPLGAEQRILVSVVVRAIDCWIWTICTLNSHRVLATGCCNISRVTAVHRPVTRQVYEIKSKVNGKSRLTSSMRYILATDSGRMLPKIDG